MQQLDKDMIFGYLKGKTNNQDFENWLYSSSGLENRIGSSRYAELISLDYKDKFIKDKIEKIIFDDFTEPKEYELWELNRLFEASGWFEGRKIKIKKRILKKSKAEEIAINILERFGGLSIRETGFGVDMPSCDIKFLSEPSFCDLNDYKNLIGELVCFATAHHDHMALYVNSETRYFIFTDPDAQLYEYRCETFENLIIDLLKGQGNDNFLKINIS